MLKLRSSISLTSSLSSPIVTKFVRSPNPPLLYYLQPQINFKNKNKWRITVELLQKKFDTRKVQLSQHTHQHAAHHYLDNRTQVIPITTRQSLRKPSDILKNKVMRNTTNGRGSKVYVTIFISQYLWVAAIRPAS